VRGRGLSFACVAFGLLLSQACSDDDDSGSDKPKKVEGQKCQGGESFSCRSLTGCSGHQFCTSEGVLGSCICDSSSSAGSGGGSGASDAGTRDAGAGQGGDGGSAQAGNDGAGSGGSAGKPAEHDGGTAVEDAGHPQTGDEVCDNGKDDDGDGDIDCADDDCGTRSCLEAAPDGWDGPTALRIGTGVPASCTGDYARELASGGTEVVAAAASCSTCSCTASSATPSCASFLDFVSSGQDDCGGVTCAQSASEPCALLSSPCFEGLDTGSLKAQLPPGATSCTPSAQTPTRAAAKWQLSMLACGTGELKLGGCDSGKLCAPALPSDAILCVMHDGDEPCPAGDYSQRRLLYTAIDDARGCSACSCAQDCNYGYKVFAADDTSCSGTAMLPLTGLSTCNGVAPSDKSLRVSVQIGGTGECLASGGTPTGAATASGPITACCVP
jgi:hypothetical protein